MLTSEGDFIAVGHWQIGSIAVRVLDFEDKAVDGAYWEDRLRVAYDLRCAIGVAGHEKGNDTYRLVHGEGDCLPGLVVDVYGKTAVMQAHSVGHARGASRNSTGTCGRDGRNSGKRVL